MDVEELIESIIRALMFIAGVIGNSWLAICSFPKQKSGTRTNEVLFINLAVSNLITNCLVDLPDTMADFAGRWFLGETFCGVFRFCADLSETSSIFTTFFISTFWYQKLVGSLKHGGARVKLDSLRLVSGLLAGSWTVAVVFSVPHFFFVVVEGTNESEEDCLDVFPNAVAMQAFDITYLTVANAFPLAGIVFASVQIVITLFRNQRRIRSHGSDHKKETVRGETGTVDKPPEVPSAPNTSDDRKVSPSLTNVYVSASAYTSGDLSSKTPQASPLNDTGGKSQAQPSRATPNQAPAKSGSNTSTQVRAAKSVVAVASVVVVCWLTHLLLRITNNIHTSSIIVEVASYIAASYTCIIPYIFLHGVKKLTCSCKR